MYSFSSKLIKSRLLHASAAIAVAIIMPSCGGGGGGSGNPATEPAPQTLNALSLTMAPGLKLTFIRDSGDTLNGVPEQGSVVVSVTSEKSGAADVLDLSIPAFVEVTYSKDVFLVTYTYTRVDSQTGVIEIEGDSSAEGYFPASFNIILDISFATNGAEISGIVLTDSTTPPGFRWVNATLELFGGGPVPVGYSVTLASFQDLPYLYPQDALSTPGVRELRILPDSGTDILQYSFQSSVLTNKNPDGYVVLDEGVAQETEIDPPGANVTVEYEYSADDTTIDQAVLKIYQSSVVPPLLIRDYQLTFGDNKSGTYVDSVSGDIGEFLFPLLDNN